ncbi:hypothetical protein [Streptomyces roseolus]|uniref:hypothetical protein n=1 Tax=Streptomyces roseolus TaxID=67358 RepID=UPI0036EE00A8
MPSHSSNPGGASRVHRRALLGTVVLAVLLALAGLAAHLTRDSRAPTKAHVPRLHCGLPADRTWPRSE